MSEELTWRALAKQTSRKINFGWWLQALGTPLPIVSLFIACGILIARRELSSLPLLHISIGTTLPILLTGIICWLRARSRFESSQQSLVRIEATMRLRNALTAADKGLIAWPAVPAKVTDGTRWHWRRILTPIVGAITIIACGFLIPISATADSSNAVQEPSAWSKLDTHLNQLENQEIIQQEYIEKMRRKLEAMREQSPDEWFSHSSLEATDTLTQTHQNEQAALRNSLQRAERNLSELQRGGSKMNQAKKNNLLADLDRALQKMEQGGMKPNEKLLQQLQKINPETLNQLTPEEMNQLRENMRQHAEKLNQQNPQSGENDRENEGEEGEGEGEGGDQPGSGGISRGPGTSPNLLGAPRDRLDHGNIERLKSADKSRALPGDLLQTQDSQHDVDNSKQGLHHGGTSKAEGKGGNRVWKESLLPDEKKALKKFFE